MSTLYEVKSLKRASLSFKNKINSLLAIFVFIFDRKYTLILSYTTTYEFTLHFRMQIFTLCV